jgi:hypothetical protein
MVADKSFGCALGQRHIALQPVAILLPSLFVIASIDPKTSEITVD